MIMKEILLIFLSGTVFAGVLLNPAAARKPGETFRFAIQADSHLDNNTDTNLYTQTLRNAAATQSDFLIDLGDTFMTGKLPSREAAEAQYIAQRHYMDILSMPVLLVLGNHDGEEQKRSKDKGSASRAEWSLTQRKKYFPNPEPNGFFTGNQNGKQDYFAWTWGDALFVVLSPYWYSYSLRGGRDPWNFTIGDAQYAWLKKTLESSKAPFKFVFIHQLTGSSDSAARGGAEAAKLHEWGNTSPEFKQHRPNWPMNIHQLLCKTKVNIVFHGHDHFYAREELDGIIYQLAPQPGARNNRKTFAEEYGYKQGVFYPSSGFLCVEVSPSKATVSYIRSATPDMEQPGGQNASVTHAYQTFPQ
ncbi:MAG: metallophosphoesterase [bacterium]